MLRTDAKVGMKIVFGRPGDRAEKSVGVIERVNLAKAKVKLLEERGTHKTYPVGTVFGVPYSLMEPAPQDGDKTAVKIGGDKPNVIPGETTFRAAYADSCPLWKVLRKLGTNVYLCEVVNEPVEIDGKVYDGDWAGTQKSFMYGEIVRSVGLSDLYDTFASDHDKFYASLKPGQIVHYNNGFDAFVRCVVVAKDGANVLKPIALVGEWEGYDLPRRMRDGSIYNNFNADRIINGETMTPNSSNIYEGGYKPRNGVDPSTLQPISLAVPPMTPEEAKEAALWSKVDRIHKATEYQHDGDNLKILAAVKAILAE